MHVLSRYFGPLRVQRVRTCVDVFHDLPMQSFIELFIFLVIKRTKMVKFFHLIIENIHLRPQLSILYLDHPGEVKLLQSLQLPSVT